MKGKKKRVGNKEMRARKWAAGSLSKETDSGV